MPALQLRRPRATAITAGIAGTIALTVTLAGCGAIGGLIPALLDGGTVNTVGAIDFGNPLAIPPLAESTTDADGRRVFDLAAQPGTTEFIPGRPADTWGFNQDYLGPTLVLNDGEDVAVQVHNELAEATTVHWHGMHLPAAMDGGPHHMVEPGETWSPEWTVDQDAATLWYHPHPHGETEKHVRNGLAGMVIVKDEAESALPLPRHYGVDDFPLVVQDAQLDSQGRLDDSNKGFVGSLGDTVLVNGTTEPFLEVTTELVRLRILNASAARSYNFGFSDDREFAMIASDGGLLESTLPTRAIQLSPGERAELVVAFEPGETVVLRSTPPDLGIGDATAARNGGADSLDILELRAAEVLAPSPALPDKLVPVDRMTEADADTERDFTLDGFVINQEPMSMERIDEVVTVGDTEIWNVRNGMS
ncbi:MAG TPA: multicopper oxidase domain-containing protein, partial [Homoserinimonas sp.]|nr:multicopper oxidase domain-containing protein [Homoserinimonas sp.]